MLYEGDLYLYNNNDVENFCSQGYTHADTVYFGAGLNYADVDLSCLRSVGSIYFQ